MAASKPLSASPAVTPSAEPQVAANGAKSNGAGESLLTVNNLVMHFPLTRGIIFQRKVGAVQAVDGISFTVKPGETLGLVGESVAASRPPVGRSFSSTSPLTGEVIFKGKDLTKLNGGDMRKMRRHLQMIFRGSLRITESADDGRQHRLRTDADPQPRPQRERTQRARTAGDGRPQSVFANRYPHEFSGGQRQRIGIARAPAANPDFIVADEPVSALDVSIQAQIVNLMEDLQERFGLTYLFIAHDLSVVKHISDRVAVMYLGKIVEMADRNELYEDPLHPYTKALLSAVPIPDPVIEKRRERIILLATFRARSTRPRGAISTPAARTRWRFAARSIPSSRIRVTVTSSPATSIRGPGPSRPLGRGEVPGDLDARAG